MKIYNFNILNIEKMYFLVKINSIILQNYIFRKSKQYFLYHFPVVLFNKIYQRVNFYLENLSNFLLVII